MKEVAIRRLGAGDLAVLRNVAEDVFDDAITDALALEFLADANHILIVAITEDLVIGQIAGLLQRHIDAAPDLYIDNLGVSPAWRRQGIAKALLGAIFDVGKGMGCKSAWIAVDADNSPAIKLYENTGAVSEAILMLSYEHL